MGCADSNFNAEEYGEDHSSEHPLNESEQKTGYEDLPKCTMILGDKIDKYFHSEKVLGSGGSCRVLKAKKRSDRSLYAMKELTRDDQWNPMLFKKEIEILTALSGHSNVLGYRESYVNDTHFYLCTQLCTGGELFDKVKKLKHFSESSAAEVVATVIRAIGHIHSKKIVHRDLKPENIVYETRKTDSDIVLIDFGDAERVKGDQTLYSDFVGTPFYLAPESVRHRCGWELYKSDMWAVGVITYVLLTGRPPFWGRNNREILTKIIKADIHWPSGIELSPSCKQFITELLSKDPRKRLSAKEALQHDWIKHDAKNYNEHLGDTVIRNIKKFQSACRLKRLIVSAMVRDMSDADKKVIARAFHELDENSDGFVDKGELIKYLLATGDLNRKDASMRAKELINGMDMDGDGKIDLTEWMHGKTADALTQDSKMIEKQFQKILSSTFDTNGDTNTDIEPSQSPPPIKKTITTDEIHKSFAELVSTEELEEIIDEIDENKDGVLDFKEFQNAMRQYTVRE
eukprot:35895_1